MVLSHVGMHEMWLNSLSHIDKRKVLKKVCDITRNRITITIYQPSHTLELLRDSAAYRYPPNQCSLVLSLLSQALNAGLVSSQRFPKFFSLLITPWLASKLQHCAALLLSVCKNAELYCQKATVVDDALIPLMLIYSTFLQTLRPWKFKMSKAESLTLK